MIAKVLERTVATVWAHGAMYKAVEQLVIIYGSNIWVVTRYILKVLTAFHHRAERRITGMTKKLGANR